MLVVVDQDADTRVARHVSQTAQVGCSLGLEVHGRVDDLARQNKADRHQAGCAVRAQRCQAADRCTCDALSHFFGRHDQILGRCVVKGGGDVLTLAWIAVALIFAIGEVVTLGLVAGFIALGAVGAAVAAFIGFNIVGQAIIFGVVSLLGIVAVRRPLLFYLESRHAPETLSGAAAMVGQVAMVVDTIGGPDQRGHVRIQGEDWPALTLDGKPVQSGVPVRVVDIRRATLMVEPAPAAQTQDT